MICRTYAAGRNTLSISRINPPKFGGGLKFEPVDKSRLSGTQKLSKKWRFGKVSQFITQNSPRLKWVKGGVICLPRETSLLLLFNLGAIATMQCISLGRIYMPLKAKISLYQNRQIKEKRYIPFVIQVIIHVLMNGLFAIAAELP